MHQSSGRGATRDTPVTTIPACGYGCRSSCASTPRPVNHNRLAKHSFPRHWPRPDRTAFGGRGDGCVRWWPACPTGRRPPTASSRAAWGTEPRGVGAAVGRNPLCIIIPRHRVLDATGRLTGHAGGLDRKRALPDNEHAVALRAGCRRETSRQQLTEWRSRPSAACPRKGTAGNERREDEKSNSSCRLRRTRRLWAGGDSRPAVRGSRCARTAGEARGRKS
jgi:hypothetical protein